MTIEERIDEIRNATEPESIKPEELADILELLNKSCKVFPIAGRAFRANASNPPTAPPASSDEVYVKGVCWMDKCRGGFSAVVYAGGNNTFDIYIDFNELIGDAFHIHSGMYGVNCSIVPVSDIGLLPGESIQNLPGANPTIRIYPIWWNDGWMGFRIHAQSGAPVWSITADWTHNIPEISEEENYE